MLDLQGMKAIFTERMIEDMDFDMTNFLEKYDYNSFEMVKGDMNKVVFAVKSDDGNFFAVAPLNFSYKILKRKIVIKRA